MAKYSDYRMGSIWIVTFDFSVGTEIQKTRPALIVSGTLLTTNAAKSQFYLLLPPNLIILVFHLR